MTLFVPTNQGCQIFLGTMYQSGKKHTKLLQDSKFKIAIKFSNIFHSKVLHSIPKAGLLVLKYTIWQPCYQRRQRKNVLIKGVNFPNLRLAILNKKLSKFLNKKLSKFLNKKLSKFLN
jgi:hypothetical protein